MQTFLVVQILIQFICFCLSFKKAIDDKKNRFWGIFSLAFFLMMLRRLTAYILTVENGTDAILLLDKLVIPSSISILFLIGLVVLYRNVANLKKMEDESNKKAKQINDSNKDLEQFAYIASHDLQEPIRMISGFMSLLKNEYYEDIDGDGKEYIDISIEAAKRMTQMISGLLELSRVGRNNNIKRENLIPSISKAIDNIKKEKVDIAFNKDDIKIAMIDELQMISLFQNIISNAIKYCEVDPEIIIDIKENKDSLLISIKDNGIGIAKESQKDIFLAFKRLSPDKYSGTGIGLSLCDKIVTSHHGKIWVESNDDGNGSTFYIELPNRLRDNV